MHWYWMGFKRIITILVVILKVILIYNNINDLSFKSMYYNLKSDIADKVLMLIKK